VEIQSYVSGCFALGNASGYIAPAGADPEADLAKWFAATNAGEPANPEDEAIAKQLYTYHQGYGIPPAGKPLRCCCRAAGPTTCSRRRSRFASTTRCARSKATRRCSSATWDTAVGSNRKTPITAFQEQGASFLKHA